MVDIFQKRYESMSDAAQVLELRNALLTEEKEVLVANLINCQTALNIAKETLRNVITEQNAMKDDFSMEIAALRIKLKESAICP